ncbi:hypothetical protein BJY01DRAFT_221982 [Aspergillus pseudoustus]|uniref:GPI inositol-deacylase n=1 Tax=Aspergillus pseudoustus TaxID=1810923 RepID=A0ABR4JBT0_9EURO
MARSFSLWANIPNLPYVPRYAPIYHPVNSLTTSSIGLRLLADGGAKPVVDIVFVHGLTGDRERTWTVSDTTALWPEILLPSAIPNARVLAFGYDTNVPDWITMVSVSRVGNHAMNLSTALASFRDQDDTKNRPIIFVCHSLGGIVFQDAITTCQHYPEAHIRSVAQSISGIIFLGTPHSRSEITHAVENLARSIGLLNQTNPDILSFLERESEALAKIQNSFHAFIRLRLVSKGEAIQMTSFYEELPLPGIGLVVPMQAAIIPGYPSIGIRASHITMTKFASCNDPGFVAVVGELRRWIQQIEPDRSRPEAKPHRTVSPPRISPHRSTSGNELSAIKKHRGSSAELTYDLVPFPEPRGGTNQLSTTDHQMRLRLMKPIFNVGQGPRSMVLWVAVVEGCPGYIKLGLDRAVNPVRLVQTSRYALSDVHTHMTSTLVGARVLQLAQLELRSWKYFLTIEDGRGEEVTERMSVFKVDLDKAQHILERWFALFDSKTRPRLYNFRGELNKYWTDRVHDISSATSNTGEEDTLESRIQRWDRLLESRSSET